MEHLAEHEAFLKAIYASPDDDTPRLVYADFLEEHGEPDRAAFIRLECEAARHAPSDPRWREITTAIEELRERHDRGWPYQEWQSRRGFTVSSNGIEFTADELRDPLKLRELAVRFRTDWYEAKQLRITPPFLLGPEQIEALFGLPFIEQVAHWDLGGVVEEVPAASGTEDTGTFALIDMHEHPVITVAGVEALAAHRGARRIETLVLTHNNLDNDALRAIAKSSNFIHLKRLEVADGNRFLGRTWQMLLERFGETVVG